MAEVFLFHTEGVEITKVFLSHTENAEDAEFYFLTTKHTKTPKVWRCFGQECFSTTCPAGVSERVGERIKWTLMDTNYRQAVGILILV